MSNLKKTKTPCGYIEVGDRYAEIMVNRLYGPQVPIHIPLGADTLLRVLSARSEDSNKVIASAQLMRDMLIYIAQGDISDETHLAIWKVFSREVREEEQDHFQIWGTEKHFVDLTQEIAEILSESQKKKEDSPQTLPGGRALKSHASVRVPMSGTSPVKVNVIVNKMHNDKTSSSKKDMVDASVPPSATENMKAIQGLFGDGVEVFGTSSLSVITAYPEEDKWVKTFPGGNREEFDSLEDALRKEDASELERRSGTDTPRPLAKPRTKFSPLPQRTGSLIFVTESRQAHNDPCTVPTLAALSTHGEWVALKTGEVIPEYSITKWASAMVTRGETLNSDAHRTLLDSYSEDLDYPTMHRWVHQASVFLRDPSFMMRINEFAEIDVDHGLFLPSKLNPLAAKMVKLLRRHVEQNS